MADDLTQDRRDARRHRITIIELLVALGVVGFLMVAFLVSVDPVKRAQTARDEKRLSDAIAILAAINGKQTDDGAPFTGAQAAPIVVQSGDAVQVIVRDATGIECSVPEKRPGCSRLLDTSGGRGCVAELEGDGTSSPLVRSYLTELPIDPRASDGPVAPCGSGSGCTTEGALPISDAVSSSNTGYFIRRTPDGRVEVGACSPEQSTRVSAIK
jgi:type II secretory pathway pseudopilin PulG